MASAARAPGWLARVAMAIACAIASTPSHAQAWLPTRGSVDWRVSFSDIFNKKHYLPDGTESDAGHTRTHVVALQFAAGLTDRVTLTGGMPFVRARYWGARPHPTEVDDGDSHSTITDWQLGLHYQVSEGPIAFAPYVQVLSPAKRYEVMGHAAPGKGLTEATAGFFAGRNLDAWVRRTYAQTRVAYTFAERVAGIAHDRVNADLEVGFFATPRVTLRALARYQDTHGGVDVPMPPSNPLFPHHDQLAAEDFVQLGAGATLAITPASALDAVFFGSTRGRNGHKVDQGVTVSWIYRIAPRAGR